MHITSAFCSMQSPEWMLHWIVWRLRSHPGSEASCFMTLVLFPDNLDTVPYSTVYSVVGVWLVLVFQDRVSLCSPGFPEFAMYSGWPRVHRDLPASASASQPRGLKVCTTSTQCSSSFLTVPKLQKCES